MKTIRLKTTIIAVLVSTAAIFYGCRKEELLNKNASGVKSATSSNLENPFNQYGIWHNECLSYMFSREDAPHLSANELWERYGTEYFRNVLGSNYRDIPLYTINAISENVRRLVDEGNITRIIENLAERNLLHRDFHSPYLITENNYILLRDFFTFMDHVNVNSEDEYLNVQQVVRDCEQKILANYYSLLNNGEIRPGDAIYKEYEGAMTCMAIAGNSGRYWYNLNGEMVALDNWQIKLRCQKADFSAKSEAWSNGYDSYSATQISAKVSEDAAVPHLIW